MNDGEEMPGIEVVEVSGIVAFIGEPVPAYAFDPEVTAVDDLVTWLRAQLDHDEQSIHTWANACIHVEACGPTGDYLDRFDQDRMLAEITAKRAILDEMTAAMAEFERNDVIGGWPDMGKMQLARDVVELLAQPYAGRDGWRTEWAT